MEDRPRHDYLRYAEIARRRIEAIRAAARELAHLSRLSRRTVEDSQALLRETNPHRERKDQPPLRFSDPDGGPPEPST